MYLLEPALGYWRSCCTCHLRLWRRNCTLLHNLDPEWCRWDLHCGSRACLLPPIQRSRSSAQRLAWASTTAAPTGYCSGTWVRGHQAGRDLCSDRESSHLRHRMKWASAAAGQSPVAMATLWLALLEQFSCRALTTAEYCCSQRSPVRVQLLEVALHVRTWPSCAVATTL